MSTQLVLPNRVCPNDEILISLSRGEISEPALGHYLAHLETCLVCCRRSLELEKKQPNPLAQLVRQVPRESPINLPDPLWKNQFLQSTQSSSTEQAKEIPLESREFAGFQLESIIGEGRSGIVYRAYDPVVKRRVALKVLRPDIAQRPEMVATFLEEARALASVRDPHVVTLHSFGRDPMPHLTMELLEGPTLSELLAEGPIGLERTVRIVRDIALGLEALHAAYLVHRDIKPTNIRLVPGKKGEKAVVLDLGLAGEGNRRAGTPGYMAPETLRQSRPTPASDIYSLGILFRILLTHAPQTKISASATLPRTIAARRTGFQLAEPAAQRKAVPEAIARLLNEMLEYHPEARPSAQDVVTRLEHFLNFRSGTNRFLWMGILATTLLLGLFGFFLSRMPDPLAKSPLSGEAPVTFPGIAPDWTLSPMPLGSMKEIFQIDSSGWVMRPSGSGLVLSRYDGTGSSISIDGPGEVSRAALRYPYLAMALKKSELLFWDVSTNPPKIISAGPIPHPSPFVFAWQEDGDFLFCTGLDPDLVGFLEVVGNQVIPLNPPQVVKAPSSQHPAMKGYLQPGIKRLTTTMPLGGLASFDLFQKDGHAIPRFAFRFTQNEGPLSLSWNPNGKLLIAFNNHGEMALLEDELVQKSNLFPVAKILGDWHLKMPLDQLKWINETEFVILKHIYEPEGLPVHSIGKERAFQEVPSALLQSGSSPIISISTQPKKGLVAALAKDGSVRIWKRPTSENP